MPRQQCAFSKESSKYAGCGILKRTFYTRFIPIFKDLGLWHGWEKDSISVVRWLLPECYFWLKSGEKSTFRAKCRCFRAKCRCFRAKCQRVSARCQRVSARCQSQFDNSRKRKGILRKNIIGMYLRGFCIEENCRLWQKYSICLLKVVMLGFLAGRARDNVLCVYAFPFAL